jgi:FkbM family methyltransferase
MNRLGECRSIFDRVPPWIGEVPKGYVVDFLGTLTDVEILQASFSPDDFRDNFGFEPEAAGGAFVRTHAPAIGDGKNAESWFEAVNWLIAAAEAKRNFVMITLGASFGAQAVGSWRALQVLNPLPAKLVAVEPVPENLSVLESHFRRNGLDPTQHWIVPLAVGDTVEPILFPVGAASSGAQNSFSTNHASERKRYLDELIAESAEREALGNLLLHNTTRIVKRLGIRREPAEIKYVSTITLAELLGPFEKVDFLEADIQQSEILVFPPFLDLIRRKVRRIHIGTHGADSHKMLHRLFAEGGWEIVFSYAPESSHESELGSFKTNDGVLTMKNPNL